MPGDIFAMPKDIDATSNRGCVTTATGCMQHKSINDGNTIGRRCMGHKSDAASGYSIIPCSALRLSALTFPVQGI